MDLAERGLEEFPTNVELRYRSALALARAGSTEEALRRFRLYGLGAIRDEDVAALGARIAKDQALLLGGAERVKAAAVAARAYEDVYEESGGYYPAVNAATMWLIAGDRQKSVGLAEQVIRLVAQASPAYFVAASRAEALLILGDEHGAYAALEQAGDLLGDDFAAAASTRRQLRLICQEHGYNSEVVSPIAGPTVAHFCGHRMSRRENDGGLNTDDEPAIVKAIAEVVERHRPGFAYGALANGADILWAETLLRRGARLHVVLPFDRDEFVRASVADGGSDWIRRFDTCLAAASRVTYATSDAFHADDGLFRYGSELAMGLALLAARFLDSEVVQLAVWDGREARGRAGTAIDVAEWQSHDHETVVITPPTPGAEPNRTEPDPRSRVVRSLLFGDIQGYSKLNDDQLPLFADLVLGALAETIASYGNGVEARNTWGDGLYLVMSDPETAASCALDLQRAVEEIDFRTGGLPNHLALRLAVHVGPVFPIRDPILEPSRSLDPT